MECCPPLTEAMDEASAEHLARTLKALADPARIRLLGMIAAAGEACACDLTDPLGLSQPTVSHHMKILRDAGFIEREQRGKWAYYRVVPNRLAELSQAISA